MNPAQQKYKSIKNQALKQTHDFVSASCLARIIGEHSRLVDVINTRPELPDEVKKTIINIIERVNR